MRLSVFIAILIIVLSSCGPKPSTVSKKTESAKYIQEVSEESSFSKKGIISQDTNKIIFDSISVKPGLDGIDTVCLAEYSVPLKCFAQGQAIFPAFRKLSDKKFQSIVNRKIRKSVEDFINHSMKESFCDLGLPNVVNGTASANFEIIANNEKYVSVLLCFVNTFGGGNAWTPYYRVFNIDLEHSQLLNNSSLFDSTLSIKIINNRMKKYFDREFRDDAKLSPLNYPFLKKGTDLKSLDYTRSSDSLLIILYACPSAHYSESIYAIPIQKIDFPK